MCKESKEIINNMFNLDYNKFLNSIKREAGFNSSILQLRMFYR
jgi:hypothetical protein